MIRPILSYGHSILRQPCHEIDKRYLDLNALISDMWETMRNADGCGLAAPQVGVPVKVFIVDSRSTFESLDDADRKSFYPDGAGIRETFINARIINRSAQVWEDDEGCLSIPGLSRTVRRHWSIAMEYFDQAFEKQTKTFSGTTARMIQHEFDHIQGILYLDYLPPLVRKTMEGKLRKISRGQLHVEYPMKFV